MLRSKRSIIVFVIAQVLLITLVIGLGFFMLSQHEKSDWQEFRSQHQHTTLLRIEKNVNQSDAPKTWLNNIILNDAVLSISLWGEKGQVLAYLGSAKYVQTHDNSELEENVDVISSSIKISQRQIHVKTIYHNQSFMEKKYVTKFSLMGILLLGMMSSVVSFFVFSLWNSHNKRAVKKLATKVARGDFESRLLIENNDEFQQVAEIINAMLDSVELTQKRQTAIVQSALDSIISTNEQGCILEFNPAAERMFGYKKDEVMGRSMEEVLLPENKRNMHRQLLSRFAEYPSQRVLQQRIEVEAMRSNGDVFPAEVAVSYVEFEGQKIFTAFLRDLTELRKTQQQLNWATNQDSLTNLPNRSGLRQELIAAIHASDESGRIFTLIILDLDRFKDINDSMGHEVGDALLRVVADRIKNELEATDLLARLGGDEFAIILHEAQDSSDVQMIARRIISSVSNVIYYANKEYYLQTSIGVTFYPFDEQSVEGLLRNAETAMYRAKSKGGATYQFYAAEMSTLLHNKIVLETALRQAVERNELILYYQPKIDLATGEIYGMEALVRWNHPEQGLLAPNQFIYIAEETGLISEIGDYVLKTACAHNKRLMNKGYPKLNLSINLSARQFRQGDLITRIYQTLKQLSYDPKYLELEITESLLMEDAEEAVNILHAISTLGIRISMDDFGTGFSSLSYLKKFPIDTLKIDRTFIRDIITDPEDASIVRAIMHMGQSLGLEIVAEGVETLDQLIFLINENCNKIQGYYFSQPLPADLFEELLNRHSSIDVLSIREKYIQ